MKKILITIIFTFIYSIGVSQIFKDPRNIFPYAPETSSLVKYQETPVSNYTGVPNISIPIYTVKSGGIEVPITLNYHSGGILVSEIAGTVGLGWSIGTISPITRKINGYTDENGVMKQNDNIEGFLTSGIDNQQLRLIFATNGMYNESIADLMSDEFNLSINNFTGSFLYNPKNKRIATFPISDLKIDYYIKNIRTNRNQIDTINVTATDGLKYTFGGDGVETFSYNGGMSESNYYGANAWKIKKLKGIDNNEINFSYISNNILKRELPPQVKFIKYTRHNYVTGCNFPDPPGSEGITPNFDTQYSTKEALLDKIETTDAIVNFIYSNRLDFSDLKKLDKIIIRSKSGEFISEKKFNYDYFQTIIEASGTTDPTENPAKKLKLISYDECDKDGKCISTSFEYYEGSNMTQRLSYATDHWGYYNGKLNNDGFPNVPIKYIDTRTGIATTIKGLVSDLGNNVIQKSDKNVDPNLVKTFSLKSITYPEGGKNEYIYEANTASSFLYKPNEEHYFLPPKKKPTKSSFFKVSGYANGPNLITDDPASPTTNTGPVKTYVWEVDLTNYDKQGILNIDYSSTFKASNFSNHISESSIIAELSIFYYKNGVKTYWFQASPMGTTQSITRNSFNNTDVPNQKVYAEIKHEYWGGLNWGSNLSDYIFFYSQITFSWDEKDPNFKPYDDVIYGGGIRIKEIKQYDNGIYKHSTKYSYIKDGNQQLSSGILFNIPMYTKNNRFGQIKSHSCSGNGGVLKTIEDGTEISVRPATAGMRTQGKTIGYTNVEVIKTDASNNTKGKEIYQYYVEPPLQTGDNSLAYVESTQAKYEFMESRDWRNGELLKYIAFNNNNDTIKKVNRDFYLSGPPQATAEYYNQRNIKMLLYALISPIDYWPGGTPLRNTYAGASMMDPDVSINGIFPSYIGLNTTTQPGYFPIFVKHTDAFLLKKETVTNYFTGGRKITNTSEYFYDEPLYPTLLTSKRDSFSEGSILNTTFKYAYNKGNQLMVNKNMIGIPLEIITTNDSNNTLSKTETIYPTSLPTPQTGNLVLPISVLSYGLQNPTITNIEVSYDKYDNKKGNLLQYTTKGGISTVIIWGYNQTKPIAKIENAKLENISQSLIDGIINASNLDTTAERNNDETNLLNALNNFRSNLSNYQITTYTYDPLVGVRSVTPPSGIREVYMYDTAGRLKEVREQSNTGKLLKEFKYNYKQ